MVEKLAVPLRATHSCYWRVPALARRAALYWSCIFNGDTPFQLLCQLVRSWWHG